jgi:sucrose phosphorylase
MTLMNLQHPALPAPSKKGCNRTPGEIRASVRARLARLYPRADAGATAEALFAPALRQHENRMPAAAGGRSQRDAFLITYADTINEAGKPPLQALRDFLRKHLGDAVSFVHLLPFFPSSSDDGFSITDYRQIRDGLGGWEDVRALAKHYRLVFDAVVNHASQSSVYIRGHCEGSSRHAGFAIAVAPGTDTAGVLRTRDLPLLHSFQTARGEERLWTTFSRDQVDLNYRNPRVLIEMTDVLFFYVRNGASVLRLDAIPYLWKEAGTSCAHLPQTHEIIKLWRDLLDLGAPHVLILTETNVPHDENISYFGDHGDEAQIIYNFPLPPLLLWSLHSGDASILSRWARTLEYMGPRATYLNITSTHDGIGMRPAEGLLSASQREELCRLAKRHGGNVTGKRNADGTESVYELNITYFDALNDPLGRRPASEQIDRFVLSQAVPMALMGIPALYLPSLLGSRNDLGRVARTGRVRSINRPSFDAQTIAAELGAPGSPRAAVCSRLLHLLSVRASIDAFHPDAAQEIIDHGPLLFVVRRHNADTGGSVIACHNVSGAGAAFGLPRGRWVDAITAVESQGLQTLPPYAVRWYIPAG